MVINCVIGNLSGWILNSIREYITAALGVPSKNESGRRILDFCQKRIVHRQYIFETGEFI